MMIALSIQLKRYYICDTAIVVLIIHVTGVQHFWNACRKGTLQQARELLEDENADPNYICEVYCTTKDELWTN